MAQEDMREDLIENEPTSCIDDTCVDEKTWSWLVSYRSTSRAETVIIEFLFKIMTHFVSLALSGGTHLEPFVITTRGSV